MRTVTGSGTPTVTASSAYASGNAIGSTIKIPKVVDYGMGTILNLALLDSSNQKLAVDVLIFNQPIGTAQTDKTAVSIAAADLANMIGHVSIVSGDYCDVGSKAIATKGNLFIGATSGADNALYVQLVSRGTPTYATTTALTLKMTVQNEADGE